MTLIKLFLLFSSWNQPPGSASNQRLVAGEMEACYTKIKHCIFFSAILYFLSAWVMILLVRMYVEKAFISPSLLSAMFDYKKHFMMTSLNVHSERKIWHFPCNWWSTAFEFWSCNWGNIWKKNKKTGTHGFTPCCCIGYGWVLFNLFWDLKMLEMFVLPTYNMYLD